MFKITTPTTSLIKFRYSDNNYKSHINQRKSQHLISVINIINPFISSMVVKFMYNPHHHVPLILHLTPDIAPDRSPNITLDQVSQDQNKEPEAGHAEQQMTHHHRN